jgi:hypothetical protein
MVDIDAGFVKGQKWFATHSTYFRTGYNGYDPTPKSLHLGKGVAGIVADGYKHLVWRYGE